MTAFSFPFSRGLEKDLEVAENSSMLFQSNHGVREVDAVCFVFPASFAIILLKGDLLLFLFAWLCLWGAI